MAIGDPRGKNVTYLKVAEEAKIASGTTSDPYVTNARLLDIINMAIYKAASVLNRAIDPCYSKEAATQTIVGSANPYYVDLSTLALDKIISVVAIKTSGGARTVVQPLATMAEAESLSGQATHASAVFYVWVGDSIKLFQGSSGGFTSSDKVTIWYYEQPKFSTTAALTDKLDILDKYSPLVIDIVTAQLIRHKTGGVGDPNKEASIDKQLAALYQIGQQDPKAM
jgi:hypothetical protein